MHGLLLATIPNLANFRNAVRWTAIELASERQRRGTQIGQPLQHCSVRNQIERANPIYGQNCGIGVQFTQQLENVRDTLTSGPGGEGVLERRCGCNRCITELLSDRPGHQPLHDVACDNATNSTIGLP